VEPDQADIRILMIKLGPVQTVRVGPPQAVLTTPGQNHNRLPN
jgi:hypothetical protein